MEIRKPSIIYDRAIQFVAADKGVLTITDVAQSGLDVGTSDFSFSFWFNSDTLPTYQTFLRKTNIYYLYVNSAGRVTFQCGNPNLTANSANGVVVAGTWYFVAVTVDRDGSANVYLNNSEIATVNVSSQSTSDWSNASSVLVGGISASSELVNGKVDSMSFSSRLLTANEITWLYNNGNGRVYRDIGIAGTDGSNLKTNLVSWWDFGENAGTRYDSHGTNHLSQTFANIIAPPTYGSELLTNAGFETAGGGGADVFGTWVETTGDGTIVDETTLFRSGAHAAKLTAGATANTKVAQTVAVVASVNYRLSFWTRGDGTYGGQYGVYDVSNSANIKAITATAITGTTYSLITYDFTTPVGCTSVRIDLWNPSINTGIAYFDDISLKAISASSLNNGGFEDWTTATNAGTWTESVAGASTVNREDAAPYHGTNAARFDVDASNSAVGVVYSSQTNNKLYSYSFYAKALSGTPTMKVDGNTVTSSHTLTTSYALYSGSIRPTGQLGWYRLSATSNSIYLDSVTLIAAEILGTTGIPRARGADCDGFLHQSIIKSF